MMYRLIETWDRFIEWYSRQPPLARCGMAFSAAFAVIAIVMAAT
jgi:hypothetical protein